MMWSGVSNWPRQRTVRPAGGMRAALTIALAAAALLIAAPLSVATAQTSRCEIPEVASAAPSPAATEETSPTPVGAAIIQVEGQEGTPVTIAAPAPMATPIPPTPDPVATLTQELTAVSEALAACLSTGDVETVVELAGERYLGQMFGGSVPLSAEEYIALASQLTPTPTRILTLEDVAPDGDDRATAIVTHVVGNQLMRATWIFTQVDEDDRADDESRWRLDGERQLEPSPPLDASPLGVEIGDLSFDLSANTVAGPDVVLRGINVSAEDHEMLVLRLDPGYTTADLLRATGPDLPQEVTFVGERPVPAGEQADLVLVDLDPGDYTLVCLFTDPQGLPHLAQGMEAVFTVE
jgi:hypothetical protein